jgi:hypothetical protein
VFTLALNVKQVKHNVHNVLLEVIEALILNVNVIQDISIIMLSVSNVIKNVRSVKIAQIIVLNVAMIQEAKLLSAFALMDTMMI